MYVSSVTLFSESGNGLVSTNAGSNSICGLKLQILMITNVKDRLQSLLRIDSAHNKCGPHIYKHFINFAFCELFLNLTLVYSHLTT